MQSVKQWTAIGSLNHAAIPRVRVVEGWTSGALRGVEGGRGGVRIPGRNRNQLKCSGASARLLESCDRPRHQKVMESCGGLGGRGRFTAPLRRHAESQENNCQTGCRAWTRQCLRKGGRDGVAAPRPAGISRESTQNRGLQEHVPDADRPWKRRWGGVGSAPACDPMSDESPLPPVRQTTGAHTAYTVRSRGSPTPHPSTVTRHGCRGPPASGPSPSHQATSAK